MAEKRFFTLRDGKGSEDSVFTGRSPRQAALKAANAGILNIVLRERGTKKLHYFTGSRKQIAKPAGAPDWMPDKVWKPNVKKVRIEHLEHI